MKLAILSFACVMMTLGLALADYGYGDGGYGGGYSGGYSYMPVMPGYGGGQAAGGFGNGGFLMLIGFLFLIMILFNGSLFNTTSSTPTISISG